MESDIILFASGALLGFGGIGLVHFIRNFKMPKLPERKPQPKPEPAPIVVQTVDKPVKVIEPPMIKEKPYDVNNLKQQIDDYLVVTGNENIGADLFEIIDKEFKIRGR